MNIDYTWRNTVKSEAIEALLEKKLEKLEKHADHVDQIHVIFETHGKQEYSVKATAHLPGIEVHAHAKEDDMYKAIDAAAHKFIRQIESHKNKLNEHRDNTHYE